MKKFLLILSGVIVFAACQKNVDIHSTVKRELVSSLVFCQSDASITPALARIQLDRENASIAMKRNMNPPGKNKPRDTVIVPPTDTSNNPPDDTTTVPTDTTTGHLVMIFLQTGPDTTSVIEWTQTNGYLPIITPATELSPERVEIVMDTLRDQYKKFRVRITKDRAEYLAFAGEKTKVVLRDRHWDATRFNTTGLAYPYSLRAGTGSVVWVFTGALYGSGSWTGKLCAHESGHSFGLQHQRLYGPNGELITNYRNGCTMGECYYVGCFWVRGLYWWPDYWQDDEAVIAARAGRW